MVDTTKPDEFTVKNESVKDRIETLDSFLDDYSHSLGLGKIQLNTEAQQYLELTYSELNAYDEEECNIASYILERYALFLQKQTNRIQAKHDWASENIIKVVGKVGNNYGDKWTKYEMKKAMVIQDNEYAQALQAIMMECQAKINETSFIVRNITSISNTFKSLAISKYKGKQ